MADWHLKELDDALTARGWRLVAHHPGDGYRISGSWELERSTNQLPVFVDFSGFDDMNVRPLSRSYGCCVRDRPELSLYFGRPGERWKEALRQFVTRLDLAPKEGR